MYFQEVRKRESQEERWIFKLKAFLCLTVLFLNLGRTAITIIHTLGRFTAVTLKDGHPSLKQK